MKFLIAILSFSSMIACGSQSSFMPDNDLWQQDCITCEKITEMTENLFNEIINAGKTAYEPLAQANNEKLVINNLWENSTVNANCCRGCTPGQVTVNMYGGLARREEIIPEGFAMVLCHELAHAYGGTPYIRTTTKMSAEGQADYAGAKECFEKIQNLVPKLKEKKETYDKYVETKCEDDVKCLNGLEAGLSLGSLLSILNREKTPSYETPDPKVVTRTILTYPDTTQCRVDTYHAGILNLDRPKCWFKN